MSGRVAYLDSGISYLGTEARVEKELGVTDETFEVKGKSLETKRINHCD